MENAPVIQFSGMNIPSEVEERFNKWYDAAYGPIYLKNVGMKGIDRYRIVIKELNLPCYLHMYHHGNLNSVNEHAESTDRIALVQDILTWPIEWLWHSNYQLVRSFRNKELSRGNRADTIIDDTPIIHIEGYKFPASESEKYNNWFIRLSSRLYIPLLLKGTKLKCFNCFRLLDFRMAHWEKFKDTELDLPPFMSIAYFENIEDFEDFSGSLKYTAFKRSLEVEFSGNLKTVWDTEYQLFKSYRPQQ